MIAGFLKVRRLLALTALTMVLPLAGVTNASAWSGSTSTGTLPSTRDYIQTNTWMGTDTSGSPWDGWFSWQSSSYLYGTYPNNGYWIQDSNTLQVNGCGASLSNTGGGVQPSSSTVVYSSRNYYNWFAGGRGYNEHWQTPCFWNLTSSDSTAVQPWTSGSVFYNSTSATKWW